MSQSVRAIAPSLAVTDGIPTTTSIDVARHFGKQHDDVLRRIRALVQELPEEPLRNFAEGFYTLPETGAQQHKLYRLTRDGFTLLAMGFTGKKALAFKLAYIDAFNRMEAELQAGAPERLKLAQSLAAEVAAQASRTVFEAVMNGQPGWRAARWMFGLTWDPNEQKLERPWARAIEHDAVVASLKKLAAMIEQDGGLCPTQHELLALAVACNTKLAKCLARIGGAV